jgi:hypothetical protein
MSKRTILDIHNAMRQCNVTRRECLDAMYTLSQLHHACLGTPHSERMSIVTNELSAILRRLSDESKTAGMGAWIRDIEDFPEAPR